MIVGAGAWFFVRRYRRRRQQDLPVEPQLEQYSISEQENGQSLITPWTPSNPDKKFYVRAPHFTIASLILIGALMSVVSVRRGVRSRPTGSLGPEHVSGSTSFVTQSGDN
jgi:hypothetical protein